MTDPAPSVATLGWSRVIVVGVVLGLVAAAAVWWLERFEVRKLHAEIGSYLERYGEFRRWESDHTPPPPPAPAADDVQS